MGDVNRPNQPIANRPGIGDRPGVGDRPGIGERPGVGNRPVIGGDRPNVGNRPVIGSGNNNNIVNRPGGNNNINIDNNHFNNINSGNWGINNHQNWGDNWNNHYVNGHYNSWYHGCWCGHGYGNWYGPAAVGAVGWGMYAMSRTWGYGPSYSNPYYDSGSTPGYDYSQPIIVNNYATPDPSAPEGTPPQPVAEQTDPATQQAMKQFDDALASFKSGGYQEALASCDSALKQMPNDPVLHEVRALCLFALGKYQPAAATLNSLLASAPGMDWATMSGLYGDAADYTRQLRALESYVKGHLTDSAAQFVLAYHYLVLGEKDAAIRALKVVVKQQPQDVTARRMLDGLAPPEAASAEQPVAPEAGSEKAPPEIDLVGSWVAKSGSGSITLTIDEQSQFTWKTEQSGKPIELKGQLTSTTDTLVLESADQGTMVGKVKVNSADSFQFLMSGLPSNDPGLTFRRSK